jgi:enoyl-[acyl-carrier protein] reductase I
MGLLTGKIGIVFGVANKRSIAWAIAQALGHVRARTLAFTYQGERLKDNVEELAGTFGADTLILPVRRDQATRTSPASSTQVGAKFGRLEPAAALGGLRAEARRWRAIS